eukprot:gene13520-biopygen8031
MPAPASCSPRPQGPGALEGGGCRRCSGCGRLDPGDASFGGDASWRHAAVARTCCCSLVSAVRPGPRRAVHQNGAT